MSIADKNNDPVRQLPSDTLPRALHSSFAAGHVAIVGAGPGAADLLTIRAWQRIQQADVIIHDRLIDPEVLALIPFHVKRLYVGKAAGNHSVPQARIHELLIAYAQAGLRVVRLKGGDPFVFGRGGEEMQALQVHAVPYEIVPGISAAQGCAAATGIPLTHRDLARHCILLPAHLADDGADLNWSAWAKSHGTLAFYMGTQRLQHIASQLIKHGLDPEMPAALVYHGTRKDQRLDIRPLHQWKDDNTNNYCDTQAGLFIVSRAVTLSPYYAEAETVEKADSGF